MKIKTKIIWRKAKLKDICQKVDYGYTASAVMKKIGPKFLRITDIVPDFIDWDNVPYCKITNKDYQRYKLEKNDIVIARTGATTGYAKQINRDIYAIFASYLVRIRINKKNNPVFIGKIIQSEIYKRFINANLTGSAQPQANAKILTSFEINLPNIKEQKQIALILSAYDDLIEVNNKKIKNLEEIAQAIYNEWFIKFKFPGYEKVKFKNGIPEGWEKTKVGNLIKRVQSGKKYDNKTASRKGKIPILDQGRSGVIGYHNNEPGVVAGEENPIIVFANHTCYQNLIMFPFSAIQNVLPFCPNEENHRNIYWLHWATKDLIKFNDYKGHWPEFVAKKLLLPSVNLCNKFGDTIESMIILKYKLEKTNNNLRKTRDLLLPKLMNGEIKL